MIALIDYGVGNLFSLERSFRAIGEQALITRDPAVIASADRLLLPGVGAFEDAAKKLRSAGMDEVLKEEAQRGKPILGVCLGMQLLFERSFEYGEHAGLGLLPGEVRPICEMIDGGLKIPHIGWNALRFTRPSALYREINEGACAYFVHSYAAANCAPVVSATVEYGGEIVASVEKDNIFGCQFHPEKSGRVGLTILKNFSEVSL